MLSAAEYRESLRRYEPTVYLNGRAVPSVVDEPAFAPGINALGVTYDFALEPDYGPLMTATQQTSGATVNRMLHLNTSNADLMNKLEAIRLLCQETGCAQRYLTHDGLNAIHQAVHRIDADTGGETTPSGSWRTSTTRRSAIWPSASP